MAEIKEVLEGVSKKYGKPLSTYKIVYDSAQNQLEPIYYWLLDFMEDLGFKVEKVVDNFMSSPGSGHFSEMRQRATMMQQQGTKLSGDLHQLIKSTINIVYDLREFEQRLAHYNDERSDDPKRKEKGMLALKNIWLDNVDLPKRGVGSIHKMSAELGYVTLRDSFMIANSVEDVKKMTIKEEKNNATAKYSGTVNEAVTRILIPRIDEFLGWREKSYRELKKRYSIERNYLKSQIETIKLYSSWMKPYFEASEKLRQQGFDKSAALVNAFSTSMFELTLMGVSKAKPPKQISGYNIKRDYNSVILINLKYRGHLAKADQKGNYASMFNGKVEINLDSYSLNSEELGLMRKNIEKDDLASGMKYSFNMAEDAMKELQADFDYFLKDEDQKEEADRKEDGKNKKNKQDDINPFRALFSIFGGIKMTSGKTSNKNKKIIEKPEDISSDNWVEKHLRVEAANSAASRLYAAYDVYKKTHGMASTPTELENYSEQSVSPNVNTLKDAFQKPDKE
jgi:hypothetical protein